MILSERGSDNEGVPYKYLELKFLHLITEMSCSGTVYCSCPLANGVDKKKESEYRLSSFSFHSPRGANCSMPSLPLAVRGKLPASVSLY